MNAGNTNFASHTAAIAKNEFCVTERGNSGDRRLQPNNSLHILSMPSLPRHWFDARTENTLNARALEHTRCCFISKVSCGFDFIIILIIIWLFLLQFDSCFWAGSGFSIFRWFSVFEFYFCWYCSLPLIFIVLLFFLGDACLRTSVLGDFCDRLYNSLNSVGGDFSIGPFHGIFVWSSRCGLPCHILFYVPSRTNIIWIRR